MINNKKLRDVQQEQEETIFLQVLACLKKQIYDNKYKKQVWNVKYQISDAKYKIMIIRYQVSYVNDQILYINYKMSIIRYK